MKKYRFLFTIVFAMLILLPFRVNAMSLNAYDYDGIEKIIEVESSDTIEAVKEKIGMKTGKTAEDTIIVLDGKELENGRTVADYSIESTDIIYMLGDIYITLNANEGTFENLSSDQTEYIIPDYVDLEDWESIIIPERDGYTFKGWYTKSVGGVYIDDDGQISNGMTIYAHWDKEGSVSIDFANMEDIFKITSKEVKWINYLYNKGILISNPNTGEIKNKDGKVLMIIDVDNNNKLTLGDNLTGNDNIVYELTEEEKEQLKQNGESDIPDKIEIIVSMNQIYKLVFDANGGTFKNDVKTINIEDIINFDYETFEKPTRNGYKFIEFYTEDNKSFADVMNSEAGIEKDTTFYAKWQEISAGGGQPGIPEEENPKTFDGIENSIIMGTISLIGLVGATIYFRKRNKVRA